MSAILIATLLVTTLLFVRLRTGASARVSLPPGPPRHWLTGNLFDLPKVRPWETFRDWCDKYGACNFVFTTARAHKAPGDVIYLAVPSRPIVILGSIQAATQLLHLRSDIYSNRPKSIMRELCVFITFDVSMFLQPQTKTLGWDGPGRFHLCHTARSGA